MEEDFYGMKWGISVRTKDFQKQQHINKGEDHAGSNVLFKQKSFCHLTVSREPPTT